MAVENWPVGWFFCKLLRGSDTEPLASQGVRVGSLGAYSGLTRDLSRPHLAHL